MNKGWWGCLSAAGLINLIAGYSYSTRVNITGLRSAARATREGERIPGRRRVEGRGNIRESLSDVRSSRGGR